MLLRFIPACAGNSRSLPVSGAAVPVHPRLRGELISLSDADLDFVGSSPLARGTQNSNLYSTTLIRFIPACAGNSLDTKKIEKGMPVHPRLRGELSLGIAANVLTNGSSPLARGTLMVAKAIKAIRRFIPACAGNSLSRLRSPFLVSVHPRLRGEL